MVRISIVIATYNRGEKLARTLRSLVGQTLPRGEWEAVVVNNNSTDDTPDVFARFAAGHGDLDIRMVTETRQGLSWARNRGIAEVKGEIIVMIDDDEEVNPEFLEAYDSFFASHPQAVAAGGKMVACYEEARPRWMSHYTEALAASTIDLGGRVCRFPRGKYPIGGNMAFRREVFDLYGGFDTSLGRTGTSLIGGEEKDLFGRIAAGGGAVGRGGRTESDSVADGDLGETVAGRVAGGEIWWVPGAAVDHLIPPSRLTDAHFRKLSRMVGVTKRIISRGGTDAGSTGGSSRGGYLRALVTEGIKWGATIVLVLWFLVTLRPSKARYLLIMRRNISAGLLSGRA